MLGGRRPGHAAVALAWDDSGWLGRTTKAADSWDRDDILHILRLAYRGQSGWAWKGLRRELC